MKAEVLFCEHCEAPLPAQNGKGRAMRYCSPTCKKAAYRQRNAQRPGQCEHCGQVMDGDGQFCSDRCFYHGHDGSVPFDRLDLAAFDEVLIPIYPRAVYSAGEALARMRRRQKPLVEGQFDSVGPLLETCNLEP